MPVYVDIDWRPGLEHAAGDYPDRRWADIADDGGQLGVPIEQEGSFSFGADGPIGGLEILIHEGKIGRQARTL